MTETAISPDGLRQLAGLASRLQNNPAFMAHVLAAYQKQERLSDEALAAQLKSTPAMVVRLALCKRPDATSSKFADQVRQIAAYTGLDAAQLAQMIRQVDSLARLSEQPEATQSEGTGAKVEWFYPGLLAAARDRTEAAEDDPASAATEVETPEEE
jgi:hypothetical protein